MKIHSHCQMIALYRSQGFPQTFSFAPKFTVFFLSIWSLYVQNHYMCVTFFPFSLCSKRTYWLIIFLFFPISSSNKYSTESTMLFLAIWLCCKLAFAHVYVKTKRSFHVNVFTMEHNQNAHIQTQLDTANAYDFNLLTPSLALALHNLNYPFANIFNQPFCTRMDESMFPCANNPSNPPSINPFLPQLSFHVASSNAHFLK